MHRTVLLVLLLFSLSAPAAAQASDESLAALGGEAATLHYVTQKRLTMYTRPDSGRAYVQLKFREPVYVVQSGPQWSVVRTRDGAQGYVATSALSNVWIRISKQKQTAYIYRGVDLVREYPVDLGYNSFADKVRRGSSRDRDHWRTPEGTFFVVNKNPRSQFYKAFVLNYPTAEDAERGLRDRLISQVEYAAILKAEADFSLPPMSTALGGWIEIHGRGTGARSNWTQGCVALTDAQMDALWSWVQVGTPVLIEP